MSTFCNWKKGDGLLLAASGDNVQIIELNTNWKISFNTREPLVNSHLSRNYTGCALRCSE